MRRTALAGWQWACGFVARIKKRSMKCANRSARKRFPDDAQMMRTIDGE
jgi:hypothetical protein